MVDLLDCWDLVLPEWVMEDVLDLFVLPGWKSLFPPEIAQHPAIKD